jgi:hypothetical protein
MGLNTDKAKSKLVLSKQIRKDRKIKLKSIIRNTFIVLCAAALFLASPNLAQAQIDAHTGDIAGNVGWSNLVGIDGNKHVNFGFSGGYNFTHHSTVIGEYNYFSGGSVSAGGVVNGYQISETDSANIQTCRRVSL